MTVTPNGFDLDTTGRRIVVDPVTRIEGHMRCEVNVDEQGVIRNAVSTGTMWRGLEVILKGRDPRDAWAFTERICGVCTGTHALTSVRAVEDALGITIPDNANSIRNIMQLNLEIHDHVVHFYHLHALDWVNPINALRADPKATSELQQAVSPSHPLSSPGYFRDVQNRLKKFVESGQLGLFKNGYWDNPAYLLPPEADLMATTHYLEALDLQKEIVKVHTIFGGKNPHPNWLVGGVPCPINVHSTGAVGAINMERLNMVSSIIDLCDAFNRNVYLPDVIAIGGFYKQWLHGGGLSGKSVMAYGDFPENPNDFSPANLHLPRGAIINGNLDEVHEVDVRDPERLAFVTQTTLSIDDTADIVTALRARFPSIKGPHKEDICYATTNRQEAVKAMAPHADAMLVVGAPNSSNSRRLVEVGAKAGCGYSQLVQRAGDIDWRALDGIASIGITAGASAPEVLVNEVIDAFRDRYDVTIELVETAQENVEFKVPRVMRETA